MKVLILGATGMLGSSMFNVISEIRKWQVYGTVRSDSAKQYFPSSMQANLLSGIVAEDLDSITRAFIQVKPEVVINCMGLVKQLKTANDPVQILPINSLLPHRLVKLCELTGARLVHISTDCVFSGRKGNYKETDVVDAVDLYGKSKYLGEVNCKNAITLRTSIIGHELNSSHGLVEWFLRQNTSCVGYAKAVFSGIPTVVLAEIIRDVVIPRRSLHGVYHISSTPITKLDLLRLISKVYGKTIEILVDNSVVVDRSLNSTRFQRKTGYKMPEWNELIQMMYASQYPTRSRNV